MLFGLPGDIYIYIWEATSVELLGGSLTNTSLTWGDLRLAEIAIDALVYGRVRDPQM